MSVRATFTLENDVFAFLRQVAGNNRSAYVNMLIEQERQKALAEAVLQANEEEANDEAYQAELAEWDVTLEDGLTV